MASFVEIGFSIDRSSFPAGSICTINYHYFLQCDAYEIDHSMGFSLWCEVWGNERLGKKMLAGALDNHTLVAATNLQQTRSFVIQCELLDDRLGEDNIYLLIKAHASNGVMVQARSPLIKEHF